MKKSSVSVLVSAGVSVAFVVAALVLVRNIGQGAYEAYLAHGGENGFWPWFAKDVCGVTLPGVEDKDEIARTKKEQAQREAAERAAKLDELKKKRIAKLEAEEKKRRKALAGKKGRKVAEDKSATKRRSGDKAGGRRGGSVKTSGKSSFVAGDDRTPYRVNGIRGIEFGSTENAPAEGVLPLMSVTYDENGNAEFKKIRWREDKKLTDSVYGFDKAWLNHSFESEQLASVTFHKSFPFTEEGMAQAVAFYKSMSSEASADLGFDIIDVDRTGNAKTATICEFKNSDSDTDIRGAISSWSDKSLTVTFSVSDKAYSKELRSQSDAAYAAGVADSVKARIENVGPFDYSERMSRAAGFFE